MPLCVACVVEAQYHGKSACPPSFVIAVAEKTGSIAAEEVVSGERE